MQLLLFKKGGNKKRKEVIERDGKRKDSRIEDSEAENKWRRMTVKHSCLLLVLGLLALESCFICSVSARIITHCRNMDKTLIWAVWLLPAAPHHYTHTHAYTHIEVYAAVFVGPLHWLLLIHCTAKPNTNIWLIPNLTKPHVISDP